MVLAPAVVVVAATEVDKARWVTHPGESVVVVAFLVTRARAAIFDRSRRERKYSSSIIWVPEMEMEEESVLVMGSLGHKSTQAQPNQYFFYLCLGWISVSVQVHFNNWKIHLFIFNKSDSSQVARL